MIAKPLRVFSLLLFALSVSACHVPVKAPEEMPNDPRFAPVYNTTPVAYTRPTGAIYKPGFAVDLYQRRAHRIGDILTINLNESTSASKSSNASFTKASDSSVTDQSAAGKGFLGTGISLNGSVSSSVDFNGASGAGLSNQLQGSITVTVAAVLANGVLQVRGEKWLELNRGSEFIRISGLVRREDISPNNTVDSTRIADVRIAYSGTGELNDATKASWLTKFFVSEYWPF